MQKIIISVLFVFSIFITTIVFATDAIPAGVKAGVLDIEQVMTKTGATDRATNKIRKQYASQQKILEKEEQALQRDVKKYNSISDKLPPEQIKQWQRKINAEQTRLRQKQAIFQEKVISAQEDETKKIISRYFSIVTKIAEKHDLALVFFADVTAFNSVTVHDITNEVINFSVVKQKIKPKLAAKLKSKLGAKSSLRLTSKR